MKELTHLSLFSGIGGLDLAAELAGFKTVGQCEWADYPTKVLEQHWPDVPRWRDIRTLTGRSFYEQTGRRAVDLISGGFPCQPFSVAGKRRGKEDDRYLWPEMVRVIKELRPTWIIGENVAGIIKMALPDILSELEACGYRTRAFLVPACGVGARHRRNRVVVVGWNADSRKWDEGQKPEVEKGENANTAGICADMANPNRNGTKNSRERKAIHNEDRNSAEKKCQWNIIKHGFGSNRADAGTSDGERAVESFLGGMADGLSYWLDGYWGVEPDILRVALGILNRIGRLKCLGNAVVPQQFYPFFRAIYAIEMQYGEKSLQ